MCCSSRVSASKQPTHFDHVFLVESFSSSRFCEGWGSPVGYELVFVEGLNQSCAIADREADVSTMSRLDLTKGNGQLVSIPVD